MAATKCSEVEYNVRKNDKMSDYTGRRTQKHKISEQSEGTQKKQTRAKTRTGVSDDGSQSSLTKVREKGKSSNESAIDDASMLNKKDASTENSISPKKESEQMLKKDSITTISSKKDLVGQGKKEPLISCHSQKETENADQPKKEMHVVPVPKKEVEVMTHKSRKSKLKLSNNVSDKKSDDKDNSETKSDIPTIEKSKIKEDKIKSDKRENGTFTKLSEKPEIMNSDVSSSVDVAKKIIPNHSPDIVTNVKDGVWKLGDIAWGRVGQHPFWPCIIAKDHQTGQYSKTKRVGRGLNSVQQSLHVQFFGDKGRHSWIPSTCVMKYEGKELFQKFADKVLNEMKKKKDKRILSAYIVKPASKPRWEIAIREAEETVLKARDDRFAYFQELLPKKISKASEKTVKRNDTDVTQSAVSAKKIKRPSPYNEDKPYKLLKSDKGQVASKMQIEEKKTDNTSAKSHSRKSGRTKKHTGEFDVSGTSFSTNLPRVGLFLKRNIRKMMKQ